MLLTMVAWPCS